ncbi:hypothetical protein NE857_00245 [Nocardiopsis exhalans]|uniref:Uncharacterized protein n=2 Tax=Nocardiopsis TaxID=2013 RepID=A0A840WPS5_9ACTN|nr:MULTISPECIES: membrane protein [Nocardiopsis]MBB5493825.1 hypothetical protein [Nocardiopsis metallicus]QRN81168.1 MAG: hypothetical protein JK586_06810 [Nocardiopsis sp. BM-2018]USY20152.1 hypothetical protein NE857_00245 [Nocardiopsis exhalans]
MTLERGNAFTPVASAAMIWPWGPSVVGGTVAGALSFLANFGLAGVPVAVTTGIFFFALIGGIGGVISKKSDRRGRRWAATYPFRYAAAPAMIGGGAAAIVSYIVSVVTSFAIFSGIFGGLWTGLGVGLTLWVIIGVVAAVAGNKK